MKTSWDIKRKRLIIIGIVALLVCVGLSGCEQTALNGDDGKFIGTWSCKYVGDLSGVEFYNFTITFTENHTYQSNIEHLGNGTYEVKNKQVFYTPSDSSTVSPDDYAFSNNDQILTLNPDTFPLEFIKLIS